MVGFFIMFNIFSTDSIIKEEGLKSKQLRWVNSYELSALKSVLWGTKNTIVEPPYRTLFHYIYYTNILLPHLEGYYFDWQNQIDIYLEYADSDDALLNFKCPLVRETFSNPEIASLIASHGLILELDKKTGKVYLDRVENKYKDSPAVLNYDYINNLAIPSKKGKRDILLFLLKSPAIIRNRTLRSLFFYFYYQSNLEHSLVKDWKNLVEFLIGLIDRDGHEVSFIIQKDLTSTLKTIRELRKGFNKYGLDYIGFCEKNNRLMSSEEFTNWLKQQKALEGRDLVIPLMGEKVIKLEHNWTLVELTTVKDFKDEGDYQKHCVAGYAPRNPNPDYRIFSLRKTFTFFHIPKDCSDELGRLVTNTLIYFRDNQCLLETLLTSSNYSKVRYNSQLREEIERNTIKKEIRFTIQVTRGGFSQVKSFKNSNVGDFVAPIETEVKVLLQDLEKKLVRKLNQLDYDDE